MHNSRLYHRLWFAVAAAGIFMVTSCSDQPANKVAANTPKKSEAAKPAAVSTKATQPPQVVTVPKGTTIIATVGQTIGGSKTKPGDAFAARLSTPVTIDGKTVIPKGTPITGRVVTVNKKHELKVALASVKLHGKSYNLETNSLRPSDGSQAKSKVKSTAAAQSKKASDKTTLHAQTQLTFKLAKPLTLPVMGTAAKSAEKVS